jgi:hypothetical protein
MKVMKPAGFKDDESVIIKESAAPKAIKENKEEIKKAEAPKPAPAPEPKKEEGPAPQDAPKPEEKKKSIVEKILKK